MNQKQVFNQDILFEKMATISKACAFDIVSEQVKKLQHENDILKIELKVANNMLEAYKNFVNDIKPKNAVNAELPPVSEDDLKNLDNLYDYE